MKNEIKRALRALSSILASAPIDKEFIRFFDDGIEIHHEYDRGQETDYYELKTKPRDLAQKLLRDRKLMALIEGEIEESRADPRYENFGIEDPKGDGDVFSFLVGEEMASEAFKHALSMMPGSDPGGREGYDTWGPTVGIDEYDAEEFLRDFVEDARTLMNKRKKQPSTASVVAALRAAADALDPA